MVEWHIPALNKHEEHMWHIADDVYVSRSQRIEGNGPYELAVPIALCDLEINLPSELGTVIDGYAASLRWQ